MDANEAAALLAGARKDPANRPAGLPDSARPADNAQAYEIQAAIMAGLGGIGGWKVGSPNPTSTAFTCAPLPQAGVLRSPAKVKQAECPDRGVEAEIAVRIAHDLPVREKPYAAEEVLAAIGSAHPAIELLQSRYADVDSVDAPSNLADSLSHYALVYGHAIADWQLIDLSKEKVRLLVNGEAVKERTANPAGDMIRLVTWLANTGARWAGGLKAGQIVTTGSWTGKDFVPEGATVKIAFDHCGEATVEYG